MKLFYIIGITFILSCSSTNELSRDKSVKKTQENTNASTVDIKADCSKGMCNIPAGEFMMGCSKSSSAKCYPNEYPYHKVYLDSYKIDEHEVRVIDFMECVSAGKCSKKNFGTYKIDIKNNHGNPDKLQHPMNSVNWYGAQEYCKFMGKKLPTEAQWEKAARAGSNYSYFWGNDALKFCDYANLGERDTKFKTCNHGSKNTIPVKKLKPNKYGLYDISGNVWEWVMDDYSPDFYKKSPFKNPVFISKNKVSIFRGGGWGYHDPEYLSLSMRGQATSKVTTFHSIGFRCAK